MSAVASITVTGIADIRARLTPEAFRATLLDALRQALAPVATSASALAPRKSGALAAGIRAVVATRGDTISAAIVTGVRYGHLVEYGHRQVSGGRAARGFVPLSFRGRFTGRVVGQVPAHPFARPAFAAQQNRVSEIVAERLAAEIAAP